MPLVAVVALAAAASAQAGPPRSFFGVVSQTPYEPKRPDLSSDVLDPADIARMGQARVGTLRVEVHWASIDPTPAAGDYDFSRFDALVGDAARNGVQILPFVYSTPEWVAKALDGRDCSGDTCYPFAPMSPGALAAWQTFLGDLVARYGPTGTFWAANPRLPRLPITRWQAWNEQNSPRSFAPKPNVKGYARLLDATHSAIRAVDPEADVILGGMFGTPYGARKPSIAAWDFLRRLYRIKGAKKDFEGVAAHPYAARLKKVKQQMELFRDEIKRAADRKVGLWITELGWASDGPKNPLNRGWAGQALRLKQVFRFFVKRRRKWKIKNVDWYSWRDNRSFAEALCVWCPFTGLVTDGLGAKPSLEAFVGFTGGS